MKAILVIDKMPKDCRRCQLMVDKFCYGTPMDEVHDNININDRPSWCPLRPLPGIKYISLNDKHDDLIFQMGWNACIEEITGETE